MKDFIVDLYDSYDGGWCGLTDFYGWKFDSVDDAIAFCDAENDKAGDRTSENVHYGVIYLPRKLEIYCGHRASVDGKEVEKARCLGFMDYNKISRTCNGN